MNEDAKRLLSNVLELAPEIAARVEEIESARALPSDLVDSLRSIGVFRMFVPRSHGGLELDFPSGLAIVSALAEIDGSVGWLAMISTGAALVLPRLPRTTYDHVYENGPDVIVAASGQAKGIAEKTVDGWRVDGRWPLASGAPSAEWMAGFCVMTENGNPLPRPDGEGALMQGCLLPASRWRVEDTWRSLGLRGSGSHHIVLKDAVVPSTNFFDFPGVSCLSGPLYQAITAFIPLTHAAVSVGLAWGALEDLIALGNANGNTGLHQQRATTPLRDTELFQFDLGRAEADIRAAQAFLQVQVESHWEHGLAGTLNSNAHQIEATQTAIWIASTCIRAVETCFTLAGSSAVYESSRLQRRLRDLRTAAQHAAVQPRLYVGRGKLLLDRSGVRP